MKSSVTFKGFATMDQLASGEPSIQCTLLYCHKHSAKRTFVDEGLSRSQVPVTCNWLALHCGVPVRQIQATKLALHDCEPQQIWMCLKMQDIFGRGCRSIVSGERAKCKELLQD